MIDHLLAQGTILLPSGLVLLLLALDKGFSLEAMGFYILGVMAILLGLYYLDRAQKKAKQKEAEDNKRFLKLINAINGIRQEIKEGRNEQNDKPTDHF
jgi:membrane protein implicated in regulation of membrane protease activity